MSDVYYIDTHFHSLEMQKKGLDINSILTTVNTKHYLGIDIGLNPDDIKTRLKLLADYESIYLSGGLYPSGAELDDYTSLIDILANAAFSGHIIAIGEIGLDYHWNYGSKQKQRNLFASQLELAESAKLPVIIHNREADIDLYDVLHAVKPSVPILFHCFSSTYDFAVKALEFDSYFSFCGNITYKKSDELRTALIRLPLEKIVLETDSPYLAPVPVRGTLNYPDNVRYLYAFASELRKISENELGHQIKRTVKNILALDQ